MLSTFLLPSSWESLLAMFVVLVLMLIPFPCKEVEGNGKGCT